MALVEWLMGDFIKQTNDKIWDINTRQGNLDKNLRYLYESNKYIISRSKVGFSQEYNRHNRPNKSNNWAVICIEGESVDMVRFVDMSQEDLREVASFLKKFDNGRALIDAAPTETKFIRAQMQDRKHYRNA